jgi:hypothetical protein
MLAGGVVEALKNWLPSRRAQMGPTSRSIAIFSIQCRLAGSCVAPIRVWFPCPGFLHPPIPVSPSVSHQTHEARQA